MASAAKSGLLGIVVLLLGCHHRQLDAYEIGADAHERAAQREDRRARELTELTREDAPGSGAGCLSIYDMCPPDDRSEEYAREAALHRERAAHHRAASTALRDAEASACAGIDPPERERDVFGDPRAVVAVVPVEETTWTGTSTTDPQVRTVGVEIHLRAPAGMTPERMQRLVDCQIAHAAAIGHERARAANPGSPLVLPDVQATVHRVRGELAVALTSPDERVAAEIVRRGRALAPANG